MNVRLAVRSSLPVLAAWTVLWPPGPLLAECSTTDLTIAARNADLSTIEGILKVADRFEAMSRLQPECAGEYFAAFRGYYREARQRWSQSIDLSRRRWALLAEERERERAPVAARAAEAGWALVDTTPPYRLEEDPRWMLARFGSFLPPPWREYLRQVTEEDSTRADALAGGAPPSRATRQGWLSFWEAFAARYGAGFELEGDVRGRITRLLRELGRE